MASDSYSLHPEFCYPTVGIWAYSNERLPFRHTPEPTSGEQTFGEAGAAAARGGGDAQRSLMSGLLKQPG